MKNNIDNFVLSSREIQVLSLIADGKSNKEIAIHLKISVSTVQNHIQNIFKKLNLDNRVDAAHFFWHRSKIAEVKNS
jgi:DNA-binding NarL/FixJ family response regulator